MSTIKNDTAETKQTNVMSSVVKQEDIFQLIKTAEVKQWVTTCLDTVRGHLNLFKTWMDMILSYLNHSAV